VEKKKKTDKRRQDSKRLTIGPYTRQKEKQEKRKGKRRNHNKKNNPSMGSEGFYQSKKRPGPKRDGLKQWELARGISFTIEKEKAQIGGGKDPVSRKEKTGHHRG